MMWNLPISVEINGTKYAIRNKCDYRVILDVISALNDEELNIEYRLECALFIFYGNEENLNTIEKVICSLKDVQVAVVEMLKIINLGQEVKQKDIKPKLMDWEHDFFQIASPISSILGYSVRDEKNYTHWYDFIGAYMEIGSECMFSQIVSIRYKKLKGEKLEKWEQKFYKEHQDLIILPQNITEEEKEWLNSDW